MKQDFVQIILVLTILLLCSTLFHFAYFANALTLHLVFLNSLDCLQHTTHHLWEHVV